MAVIMHKTQSLVLLSDEFIQKPHLCELINCKRKKGLKSLLHKSSVKRDPKFHARCMSDASKAPPQVVLTDVSNNIENINSSAPAKGFYRTPSNTSHNIPAAVSTSYISKKHLSVDLREPKENIQSPIHSQSYNQNNRNKRKTCPPNFLVGSLETSLLPSTPSSSLVISDVPTEEEQSLPETAIINPTNQHQPDNLSRSSAGEILDLEEQFSELCVMYDCLFGFNEKKNPKIPVETVEKDSSVSSHHLSDEVSVFDTPSRLITNQRPTSPAPDLLSDSDSANENHTQFEEVTIEKALLDLPPLQMSQTGPRPFLTRYISKSQFSIPSHKKIHKKSITVVVDASRPWVIIRRYGRRGGKKIRLPMTLDDLINVAGDKLGIIPVCIREVSTEAEIEDITAIEPDSVLWVMTEEDELTFTSPDLLI